MVGGLRIMYARRSEYQRQQADAHTEADDIFYKVVRESFRRHFRTLLLIISLRDVEERSQAKYSWRI